MLQKIVGDKLYIKPTPDQTRLVRGWRLFVQETPGIWVAPITRAALEKVQSCGGLIPAAQIELDKLDRKQEAMNRERMREKEGDYVKIPVKTNVFSHQRRGINMALILWGLIPEQEVQ